VAPSACLAVLPVVQPSSVVYFACPTASRSSLFSLPYQAGIKLLPRVWQQASSLSFNFRGARDQLDSPLPHRLGEMFQGYSSPPFGNKDLPKCRGDRPRYAEPGLPAVF